MNNRNSRYVCFPKQFVERRQLTDEEKVLLDRANISNLDSVVCVQHADAVSFGLVPLPQMPSFWEQVASFSSSGIEEIKSRMRGEQLPQGQAEARLGVCRSCEFASNFGPSNFIRCAKCGCLMSAKAQFVTATCPERKW